LADPTSKSGIAQNCHTRHVWSDRNGVANGGSIINTVVDGNTTNALLVNGAGNVGAVTQSLLTGSPNGINLVNGGSAISIGQTNVLTGSGTFSSTVVYK
jgi:hypothetical protein